MKKISATESKEVQLHLLSSIHDFCMEHKLKYYMMWGTLLGAVRHKGFIPWDDDVDIVMFRDDYEIFCSTYHDTNAQIIECQKNKDYYLPIAKVVDTRTVLKENVQSNMEIGVYVDIFVLDPVSCSFIKNQIAIHFLLLLRNFLMLGIVPDSDKRTGLKGKLYKIMRPLSKIINMNLISRKMNLIARNLARFERKHAFYASLLVLIPKAIKEFRFSEDMFGDGILLDFENFKFKAPAKYKDILTILYGNFMQPPPEDRRISAHEYEQYWK